MLCPVLLYAKSITRQRPTHGHSVSEKRRRLIGRRGDCLRNSRRRRVSKTFASSVPNADSISRASSNSLEPTRDRAAAIRRHHDRRRHYDHLRTRRDPLAGTETGAAALLCNRFWSTAPRVNTQSQTRRSHCTPTPLRFRTKSHSETKANAPKIFGGSYCAMHHG
jgi:hypothetical protein